jgi:hypothetical protein
MHHTVGVTGVREKLVIIKEDTHKCKKSSDIFSSRLSNLMLIPYKIIFLMRIA